MKLFSVIVLLLSFVPVFAVTELSVDYGYKSSVYGTERQNRLETTSYTVGVANYLFGLTAIELNYTTDEEITTSNDVVPVSDYGISQVKYVSSIDTKVYGVGLRQSFAPYRSRFIPALSIGYAKQFAVSQATTTYKVDSTNEQFSYEGLKTTERYDSLFATFSLSIKFTKLFSIKGSVKTVFPAFDWNKARDDLRYTAGVVWIF